VLGCTARDDDDDDDNNNNNNNNKLTVVLPTEANKYSKFSIVKPT
jgi:hypothetical protein